MKPDVGTLGPSSLAKARPRPCQASALELRLWGIPVRCNAATQRNATASFGFSCRCELRQHGVHFTVLLAASDSFLRLCQGGEAALKPGLYHAVPHKQHSDLAQPCRSCETKWLDAAGTFVAMGFFSGGQPSLSVFGRWLRFEMKQAQTS